MTPQQIDAMKLALEWFKCYADHSMSRNNAEALADEVVEAIEKALAEHAMRETQRLGQEIEQEPVAWVAEAVCDGQYIDGRPRKIWWECKKGVGTAFYTTPPQRTEQEPVAWLSTDSIGERHLCFDKPLDNDPVQPLYTAPPQHKPLTNGEIYTAYITATNQTLRATDERLAFAFARAIEAAHDIKEST
jgi:hypothetical protein